MTPISISIMYQKLLCQHHLIQDRYDKVPTVPGLTPLGFDWFLTCLIQAHPDTEYDRLAKAVMNMPISNADNKSERFPKELSRRLLPAQPNMQAAQRLISSLNHEQHIVANLRGSSHMPPPPPSAPPGFSNERERKPYTHTAQQSNAFDDEDLNGPPVQIERERKPYTGKEGAGKTYDEGRPNVNQYRPENSQFNGSRPSRTNSGLPPQPMYATSSGPSEPMSIPSRQPHRMSMGQGPPPMTNGGYSRSSRRSPPPSNSFARSQPEFVGSIPNSQYGSNLHPTSSREQYAGDPDDESQRRYRSRSKVERSSGTQNDDDTNGGRGYPIPNRGVPIANNFEYGGGPAGGPPIGDPRGQPSGSIPVGSYPSRRGVGSFGAEDRRKSMFASPTVGIGGDGGTDGYGSFASGANGGPGYPPQQQSYGSSAQY